MVHPNLMHLSVTDRDGVDIGVHWPILESCRNLRSLEPLWISKASEITNLSALAEIESLREVRLIDCSVAERDVLDLRRQSSRIGVDVF